MGCQLSCPHADIPVLQDYKEPVIETLGSSVHWRDMSSDVCSDVKLKQANTPNW